MERNTRIQLSVSFNLLLKRWKMVKRPMIEASYGLQWIYGGNRQRVQWELAS